MLRNLSTEIISDRATTDFNIGDHVEVRATSALNDDYILYIGQISRRPEDKAEDTTVTSKYGEERIIGLAPTYTVDCIAKTRYKKNARRFFWKQRYAPVEVMNPATLIFNPSSPLSTMQQTVTGYDPQP